MADRKITIRQAQAGDEKGIAYVHVWSWRQTYKNIVPSEFLDSLNVRNRTKIWKAKIEQVQPNKECIYIALDDNRVIGFSQAGTPRDDNGYDSELYAIYLLGQYQRQQIGSRLIKACSDFLGQLASFHLKNTKL